MGIVYGRFGVEHAADGRLLHHSPGARPVPMCTTGLWRSSVLPPEAPHPDPERGFLSARRRAVYGDQGVTSEKRQTPQRLILAGWRKEHPPHREECGPRPSRSALWQVGRRRSSAKPSPTRRRFHIRTYGKRLPSRAPHSINSSARARSSGGSVSPRARAVRRLTIKSNRTGRSTGSSAETAPSIIRRAIAPARRNMSCKSGP
jgi:hypothetical protein